MKLNEIAHIRTGDKGNNCNICVIPFDENDYEFLKTLLTETLVKDYYQEICKGNVIRYELPVIKALNFVMEDSLAGGVTKSLNIDRHGKSLGMALAELEIPDR
ncbi:MAG: hypothetical protein LUK37_23635 [Clostridia bacterium]|nr:hypothetical protein [Clostridia bacterium]